MNSQEALKAIVAEVRKVAEERPDYVDEEASCVYVRAGQPACLVGQALWRIGLIDASLEKDSRLNGTDAPRLLQQILKLPIGEYGDELEFLERVQSDQDSGKSWGEAVRKADAMFSYCREV